MGTIHQLQDISTMTKTRHALSLLFLCCIMLQCSGQLSAQIYASKFNNLLTEFESQKLIVTAIEQDDKGFIWFGTYQGLFRFDGVSYQRYLPQPGDDRSISDQHVTVVFNDSKGTLWIGTRHGLNRYNFFSNDFDHFKHSATDQRSLPGNEIMAIAEDNHSGIWIGTLNGGLSKLTRQTQGNETVYRFTNYRHSDGDPSGISSNLVFSIAFDREGHGLIGTDKGLNVMFLSKDVNEKPVFRQFIHQPHDARSIASNEVFKIFIDRHNNAWMISQFGMVDMLPADAMAKSTYHFRHLFPGLKKLTQGSIKSASQIFIDQQGNCWLSTFENGLYRFKVHDDFSLSGMINYLHDPADSRSLASNAVHSMFESADGCIWVGTAAGVSRWNPLQEKFASGLPAAAHFKNYNVSGIGEDAAGNIWVGTADSDTLFVALASGDILKKVVLRDKNNQADRKIYITSMVISRSGDIYAGTSFGVFILTAAEKEKFLRNDRYQPALVHLMSGTSTNTLTSNMVICMDEDKQGSIWIGTGKGVNRYNPGTTLCGRMYWNPGSGSMNTAYIIRHLAATNDGMVWLATDDGLVRLNAANHYEAVLPDSAQSGFSNIRFTFMHESIDEQTMWLGSQQGLISMNRKTGTLTQHPAAGTDLSVMAILEDEKHHLWISSQQGICRFDPATGDVKKFTAQNGLNANWFSETACYASTNGKLYFGSEKGFQVFYPDSITVNVSSPPVVITDFKLFNQSILRDVHVQLKTDFLANNRLHLKYNQNFFSVDFAALSYDDATANSYMYQLVGIDKDWVKAGNNRTATYTNISPGTYVFHVKGSNNHGIWNEQGASLDIIITPPWWQTWWFYTLCIITIVSALYALYQYRINQIKKVFTIRSKIARDLHDDIGSTLSSISLMSQLAKTGTNDRNKEASLFETISSASKEAMELMSVIVWSVNPNNDKLSNILVRMREYASDTLEACNIEVAIELDEEARDLTISMEKRKDFFLIFKEAVNNMAKYSGAQKGCIRLSREHGRLIMSISDNGQGFDAEKIRSGNGLLNMQERARSIGGTLTITTEKGKGTTVRLELPHDT